MSKKIEAFKAILDILAEKYEVPTTRIAHILSDSGIESVEDIPDWKDLDVIVQEGLVGMYWGSKQ